MTSTPVHPTKSQLLSPTSRRPSPGPPRIPRLRHAQAQDIIRLAGCGVFKLSAARSDRCNSRSVRRGTDRTHTQLFLWHTDQEEFSHDADACRAQHVYQLGSLRGKRRDRQHSVSFPMPTPTRSIGTHPNRIAARCPGPHPGSKSPLTRPCSTSPPAWWQRNGSALDVVSAARRPSHSQLALGETSATSPHLWHQLTARSEWGAWASANCMSEKATLPRPPSSSDGATPATFSVLVTPPVAPSMHCAQPRLAAFASATRAGLSYVCRHGASLAWAASSHLSPLRKQPEMTALHSVLPMIPQRSPTEQSRHLLAATVFRNSPEALCHRPGFKRMCDDRLCDSIKRACSLDGTHCAEVIGRHQFL